MGGLFENFNEILSEIKQMKSNKGSLSKDVLHNLEYHLTKVYNGLQTCGKKMTSAAKFIDFFVHDILDYTMLNKAEKNFTKPLAVFDIKEAVKEIVIIQEDKASMKDIHVRTIFRGFEDD